MKDSEIIDLYYQRSEEAITKSADKYGSYCFSIAHNILLNREDSEECVNDTWLKAWNAIPPLYPTHFSSFLAKITRNLSFNKYKARKTMKRGNGETPLALDELLECVPSGNSPEKIVEDTELIQSINLFLDSLPKRERSIFIRRYWAVESMTTIATRFHMKENNVRASLFRSRNKLKEYLEKEGISL